MPSASRRSMSAACSRSLRLKGLIRTEGRTLIVRNWSGLVETAEFDPDYLHLRATPI
jgi:hypothetical protein